MRSSSTLATLAFLVAPAVTLAQTVCQAPVDLVFILDESGSVGSSNYYKSIDFMKDMVSRYKVGTGATDAQISMISFSSRSTLEFALGAHTTNADVINAMAATRFNGGGTCTGYSMVMASNEVLCSTCPGRTRNAPSIVVYLTDANPGYVSGCDSSNFGKLGPGNGYSIDRTAEIIRLKGLVNRIIPVGIGNGISTAYLSSLAKDMPLIDGKNYISAQYSNLGAIMDDLTTAACPTLPPSVSPTAFPTAFPTLSPTKTPTLSPTSVPSAAPTKTPTFSCLDGSGNQRTCTSDSNNNVCDSSKGHCSFTEATCQTAVCGCEEGFACTTAACTACTASPTLSPTKFPTTAPSLSPTAEPTSFPTNAPTHAPSVAPTTPTIAPTYWSLLNKGTDSQADTVAQNTAIVAGAGLGALAIVAIILGIIAAIVLLIAIAAGVGIFAARKKLFETNLTVDGKQLTKGNAIGVGQQIEMSEEIAQGMFQRGELTPEQFADMGYDMPGDNTIDRLPSYASATSGGGATTAL